MKASPFSRRDLETAKKRNLSEQDLMDQYEKLIKGTVYITLEAAATCKNGIEQIKEGEEAELIGLFDDAKSAGRITKFIPASGAATRMFKWPLAVLKMRKDLSLFELLKDNKAWEAVSATYNLIKNIKKFVFYDDLVTVFNGEDKLKEALENGENEQILKKLLFKEGLNYSDTPKGLIPFHKYDSGNVTAFAEQLAEGFYLCADKDNKIRIHFTVNPRHLDAVKEYIESFIKKHYEGQYDFMISYSAQKLSTDTIAVDEKRKPEEDGNGELLFRPGGHGALIKNVEDLDADICFIKNIDNVLPEYRVEVHHRYKKLLAGYLIKKESEVHKVLRDLSGSPSEHTVEKATKLAETLPGVSIDPEFDKMDFEQKKNHLMDLLNRPIRVCGMVKNEGEPGGGPFWVKRPDGTPSLQIVEKAQIDTSNPSQKEIMKSSTHFNPVDLVCSLRDYKGRAFKLDHYIDHDTSFISEKSSNGKTLWALEHPGLWNGAMANWLTLFVEVPLETFNPVKTFLDLLRPAHQPDS